MDTPTDGKLVSLAPGTSGREIVVVTGLCSEPHDEKSHAKWLENIRTVSTSDGVSIFIWDTKRFSDFVKALGRVIVHLGSSSPIINIVRLPIILKILSLVYGISITVASCKKVWQEAKSNSEKYAPMFANELKRISRQTECKNITILSHSLGARLLYHAANELPYEGIDEIYFLGGAVSTKNDWGCFSQSNCHLINCYSERDSVLKLLYRFAEWGDRPIGLYPINSTMTGSLTNNDCSDFISLHTYYVERIGEFF